MAKVIHDKFFGATIIEGRQVIDDTIIDRAMSDEEIEATIHSAAIEDYFEVILNKCVARGYEIRDLEKEIIGKDEEIEDLRVKIVKLLHKLYLRDKLIKKLLG